MDDPSSNTRDQSSRPSRRTGVRPELGDDVGEPNCLNDFVDSSTTSNSFTDANGRPLRPATDRHSLHCNTDEVNTPAVASADRSKKVQARKHVPDDTWRRMKPLIEKYYIKKNLPLKKTMHILKGHPHNFAPCERKFKEKLKEWGFAKNVKRSPHDSHKKKPEQERRKNKSLRSRYNGYSAVQDESSTIHGGDIVFEEQQQDSSLKPTPPESSPLEISPSGLFSRLTISNPGDQTLQDFSLPGPANRSSYVGDIDEDIDTMEAFPDDAFGAAYMQMQSSELAYDQWYMISQAPNFMDPDQTK